MVRRFGVVFAILMFALTAAAQVPREGRRIKGQVFDQSDAVIPRAHVLLVNLNRLETKIAKVDNVGRFSFEVNDNMGADYEVIISCPGFVSQTKRVDHEHGCIVEPGSAPPNRDVELKITMKVGKVC